MRHLTTFACEGETLVGTLDEAAGSTGLLIVSGGNEVRHGAHRGMALLAAELAAQGWPVFRFDRQGVGDSTGANGGYLESAADIAAASAEFRRLVPLSRLVVFGNCDAASALALFGRDAGVDALVLANPWVIEPTDDLPPPAAIRAHYAARLKDPRAWLRLLRGGMNMMQMFRGLRRISTPKTDADGLADRVLSAIEAWGPDATVILARDDNTAIAYADAARNRPIRTLTIPTASHSFARAPDQAALAEAIRAALG